MCCNDQNGDTCGVCLPYKDPIFITAQILSIIAVFFSWGFWLFGLLGLAACIMLQVAWCCRMPKAAIITAGVFACLDAFGALIVAIVLITWVQASKDYYDDYDDYYDDYYYDDYYENRGNILSIHEDAVTVWAIVCFIGASLWIIVAVCCFMFACCRINRYSSQNQSEGTGTSSPKQAVVVSIPEDQPVVAQAIAEKPDETESSHEQPYEKNNLSGQEPPSEKDKSRQGQTSDKNQSGQDEESC